MPAFCLRDKLGILDLESRFCREVFFLSKWLQFFLKEIKRNSVGRQVAAALGIIVVSTINYLMIRQTLDPNMEA